MSRPLNDNQAGMKGERPTMVATIGLHAAEVEMLSEQLTELNTSRLVSCDNPETLMRNHLAGQVDLVLVGADTAEGLSRTLRWIKRQWRQALTVVISERGGGAIEQNALQHGALFLLRPTHGGDFRAVIQGMLQCRAARVTSA